MQSSREAWLGFETYGTPRELISKTEAAEEGHRVTQLP